VASSKVIKSMAACILALALSLGVFSLALAATGGECDTNYRILVKVGDVTTTKHLPGEYVDIPVIVKNITPDVPEVPLNRWGGNVKTYSPVFGETGQGIGFLCRPPCPCSYLWSIPDSSWETLYTFSFKIYKRVYRSTRIEFEFEPFSTPEIDPWGYCCDSTLVPVHTQFEPGYLTIQRPEHGCPYVYTWDGEDYVEDNAILPASEDKTRGGKEVTDCYLFSQPLVGENGFYHLQIREFEEERSFLNSFQLIEADHPFDTKVAIGEDGQFYGYKQELPLIGCIDDRGEDHLTKLKEEDGIYFTSSGPGYLLLEYQLPPDVPKSGDCKLSLKDIPMNMVKGAGVSKALDGISLGGKITVGSVRGGNPSSSIREIFPRANPYAGATVIGLANVSPGQRVTIKLAYNPASADFWL